MAEPEVSAIFKLLHNDDIVVPLWVVIRSETIVVVPESKFIEENVEQGLRVVRVPDSPLIPPA